jgi:hypothetical protein
LKLGLTDDATCERCLEDESTTHLLCDPALQLIWDFVTWANPSWNQVTFVMSHK